MAAASGGTSARISAVCGGTGACASVVGVGTEGEKNTRRGGLNCVLKNFYVPYVEKLFSGSESEVIQSLSEFRVVCSG